MTERITVALIYGSARSGRFCDTVARWVAAQMAAHGGFSVDIVDPAQSLWPGAPTHGDAQALLALTDRLGRADAFVVVTPEYNHGYPAPLKFLIDSIYAPWQAKPVAFVAYGGVSGGLRAVEQLRQVFAELHAVTVRDTVSFANAWEQFDGNGQPLAPERAQRALARLLAQLRWWALALRHARAVVPYAEVLA